MTSNTSYLHDALSRRIVHGRVTPQDLVLLNRLLICQQRKCLLLGAAAGIAAMVLVGGMLWVFN